jgi:protein-disulfide isomerase
MEIRRDGDRTTVVLRTSHLKTAAIVVAGVIGGAGLFLGVRTFGAAPSRGPDADTTADSAAWRHAPRFDVASDGRPFRGRIGAPVTIVEFTDYGCPVCRRHASEVLPGLLDRYGDTIRYFVRHFPIPALTAHALAAAEAAECAHQQGKFWEYRKALFRQTGELSEETLRAQAAAAGLDAGQFTHCLEEGATREAVERDILDAWRHGVTGTPTFFINGRRFQGARSLEELGEYIEFALQDPGV